MRSFALLSIALLTAVSAYAEDAPMVVARYDDSPDFLPTATRLNTTGARLYLQQLPTEVTVDVHTPRNVLVRVFENVPTDAKAGILMFAGGSGVLSVDEKGNLGLSFSTLSRSRDMYVQKGYATFVVDATSDRLGKAGLDGFRASSDYEHDIAEVVKNIRKSFDKPLFVEGHSMGTISAANIASDPDNHIAGVVLLSPITNSQVSNLTDVALGKVTAPTLFVTNTQDACSVSPPNQSVRLGKMLGTTDVTVQELSGGNPPASGPCGTFGYHGFFGNEQKVADVVTEWMAKH